MSKILDNSFIGVGIYSVPEASRLTDVSSQRIRRWIKGYTFSVGQIRKKSPPVWQSQLPEIDGKISLGFLDLMEVRFVSEFRDRGVSWKTLRMAAERAKQLFHTDHPFSTTRFVTDGRNIFVDIKNKTGETSLIDIVKNQLTFRKILAPYLKGLDFDNNDNALRWWPMEKSRQVVIDPLRSFGQPIVAKEGVPTMVLAKAVKVEKSIQAVSSWYDVSIRAVKAAVEYEKRLAA